MWSDTQEQPFAMGLRGTAIKRKLSEQDVGPVAVAAPPHQPSKAARADQWGVTDLPPTDLNPHHHHQQHHHHHHQNHHHHLQQQHHQQNGYSGGGQQQQQQQQRFYCFDDYRQQQQQQQQCYEQQQQQQTIRRDENGKSYLELGSWSGRSGRNVSPASRCCEARTNWCVRGPACYRQRRLAVLNISMCKLGRYRQFSDPSLHRSVLICNTLRLIEKEMEQEGYFDANATAASDVTTTPAPSEPQFPEVPVPYEPPRVPTPFPPPSSAASDSSSSSSSASSSSSVTSSSSSSTSSTTDDDRSINWGSVLSLSSQSDLDPLNNNDCLGGGNDESTSDLDDFLPAWKAVDRHVAEPAGHELESIMHVLVGT